ncbi:MAG: hypothetical protein AMJ73_03735 [candidate division Zixibacteria bacterium SM1_73]|nr:MAG: hypothetical protein AMJ73_03735 [candidate division Zixibacteria bacterium SM1_73]
MVSAKKIKIVRIISRLNIGGPSIHTVLLSAHLNSDRFKTTLVKGIEGNSEGDMRDLLRKKKVRPIIVTELAREISLARDCVAFVKLYKLICREKPDIVHTHTAKAGLLGRVAAKLAGVPIIVHTFHGHLFHSYFGYLTTKLIVFIERLLAHLTSKIIIVSEKVRKDIVEKYRIATYSKVITMPLGLELTPFLDVDKQRGFLRKELGLSDKIALVGIVARLVPVKGHKYFIEAAAAVMKRLLNVKFLVIGDGELKEKLEDYVKQLGILESVTFCGFRKDLPHIYADLDVVVLTSLNEGLPVAIIEGMAAAKPVVAFDVGGVKDLIQDNVTGILVPFGDVQKLADSITSLLGDPLECERLGQNARRKAYPYLDYRRLVRDMEEFYCQLMKNRVNYLENHGVKAYEKMEGVGAL